MRDCIMETPLTELLNDPVVELVMKSDGVDRGSLERLLATVGQLRARAASRDPESAGTP